jgi:uncharacterized protein YdeI (YjbR/CyaY-like superfamily)
MPADDLPVRAFGTPQAWQDWLAENHQTSSGLWLKIAKKGAGAASATTGTSTGAGTGTGTVTYAEALECALCFGWIDGQKGRLDDEFWLQRFTPRKARSKWSKINREKAERLLAEGRMHPAGLREVEAARSDGRWAAAYEGQAAATVPPDLARELDRNPAAREFFDTLTGVNRYAILYRIQDAKRPETRARRIATFVAMLAERKTLHP